MQLETYDTVVVRSGPDLIGTVERTHALPEGNDLPLDDVLIIAHVPVPPAVLIDFVNSGIPPKGYVFVLCSDNRKGSFLAAEDDLLLVCRSLDVGDVVRDVVTKGSMTGTIVDVSDAYTLQPVWLQLPDGTVARAADVGTDHFRDCGSDLTNCPHGILSYVPARELAHTQTVFEDDLICYKTWFGQVEEADIDVVLQLENGEIVVLSDPEDLHMPVPETDKPLVSLPELDNMRRPDLLGAFQGWSAVLPAEHPDSGTFCVTSRNTLKEGRWLRGAYQPTLKPQGTILDLIPRRLHVMWITRNPFVLKPKSDSRLPPRKVSPFLNIDTYTSRTDLVKRQDLTVIDLQSQPSVPKSAGDGTQQAASSATSSSRSSGGMLDLRVGDEVRFRDSAGAAVKYQDTTKGRFRRIPPAKCSGWDLNVLKVITKAQWVHVLWQDGTTTELRSNDLRRYMGIESEIAPSNIVVGRAGLKQRKTSSTNTADQPITEFNEMKFFEEMHDLLPDSAQVGVVQSIDTRERVAKVRWFQDTRIVLLEGGTRISPDSRFGQIGNVVEEVSLYEIMNFPAFDHQLRDIVIVAPTCIPEAVISEIQDGRRSRRSELTESDRTIGEVREMVRKRKLALATPNPKDEHVAGQVDWVGEIISLGLDGAVTVRLSGLKPCRDVVLSYNDILAVIRLEELRYAEDENEVLDLEDWLDYDSDAESASTISEHFENEAGDRIDEDSDSENWVSADEDDGGVAVNGVGKHDGEDVEIEDALDAPSNSVPTLPAADTSEDLSRLVSMLSQTAPASFEVLDIDPPPDQFGVSSKPSTASSSAFLKRVLQEHKTLLSSLPKEQIYVRTYESRLDLLRCLIIGPVGTPYEYAPFLVDLHLGDKFPDEPPTSHFHSWTSGLGRINPNLYEEGKICLSLLGTWAGDQSESWSKNATILQILVSLQGLVLVQKPFYNEAGFEEAEKEGGYKNESAQYSEKAFVMARNFVKHALQLPPVGLGDALAWLYLSHGGRDGLLNMVLHRSSSIIARSEDIRQVDTDTGIDGEGQETDTRRGFLRPLSRGAVVMLRRVTDQLKNAYESLHSDVNEMKI